MASSEKEPENVEVFDNWEDLDEADIIDQTLNILPQRNKPMETKSCKKPPVNVILLGEDALRSQYVPPEPTVKILKRPTKESQLMNGDCKPRQQFKTLEQRQQEYAQARLRILGEAHGSEKEERIPSIQNKIPQKADSDNIIRLPKGPDGTKGFNIRR